MSSSAPRGAVLRPRKRFGQHFLVDTTALEAIADLARPTMGEGVIEIGPGRGALTRPLLQRLEKLVAIEIDRDLSAHLRQVFRAAPLRLIEADVLDIDFPGLAAAEGVGSLIVVGNLPYNISAPLLFRLREHAGLIRRAVLTLQREVAERLVAPPGCRSYSLVTVLLAQCAHVQLHRRLPRGAFRPVPKVESAVVEICFDPRRVDVDDMNLFERIVRGAFSQRRKMLRNSLQAFGQSLAAHGSSLEDLAQRTGVDLRHRAEDLSVEQYALLTRACGDLA